MDRRVRASLGFIGLNMLALAGPATAQTDGPQIPSPEEAANRLAQCGFASVEVIFDDLLQEDVLTIPGIKTASDEQIGCAAHVSIETYYYLSLPEPLQDRYWQAYWPLSARRSRDLSRDWLEERGLLVTVPPYDPAITSDAAYAQALETFCGPAAKGALASDYGPHAISPDWALASTSATWKEIGEAAMCLSAASSISGFEVYFIGNERERQPK